MPIQKYLEEDLPAFLNTTSLKEFHQRIASKVIGQPAIKDICATIYSYLWALYRDETPRHNFILAAPSGSGKTETYRALRDYFQAALPYLPVYEIDASQITATGYRGEDAFSILEPLSHTDCSDPAGIIFLDEFDKLLAPSWTNHGNFSIETQSNLLTMIEGGNFTIRRQNRVISSNLNTSNLLFVGLGAFESFRESRASKKSEIGFRSDSIPTADGPASYAPLTREDLLKFGAMRELIGRFSFVYNFKALNYDAYFGIVKKVTHDICNTFHCQISLTGEYVDHLILECQNSPFGVRYLDFTLRQRVQEAWAEIQLNGVNLAKNELFLEVYTGGYDYSLSELSEKETTLDSPPDEAEAE